MLGAEEVFVCCCFGLMFVLGPVSLSNNQCQIGGDG